MGKTISGFLILVGALTMLAGLVLGWLAIEPWVTWDGHRPLGPPPFDWFGFAIAAGAIVQGVALIAMATILSMVLDLHARSFPRRTHTTARRKEPDGIAPRHVDPVLQRRFLEEDRRAKAAVGEGRGSDAMSV